MSNLIKISIPARPEFISLVRYSAALYANKLGQDIEKIEDIKLVVGEAVNNAVSYSVSDSDVEISMYVIDSVFIIEISDNGGQFDGNSFDFSEYKEPDLSEQNEGGYGIFIIRSLCDRLSFSHNPNGGTRTRIEFDL